MSTPPSSGSDQGLGTLREEQRLAALRALQVLDTPREATFDELTALVADICETPIALISFLDESRQWFKSAVGLTEEQTPREVAFCAHALDQPDLLLVRDAAQDPRFAANPLVMGEPHIRFYAGAPLTTPEGHTLGTLCVIDRVPRELNERQLTALRVIGLQVMTELQLRRRLLEFGRVEQALRQSELQQRALVQHLETERARLVEAQAVAKVGSWETDLTTLAVIWSEEAHRIFETDLLNFAPTHARFLERVHPDDRAAVDQAFRQSIGSREIQAVEHRVLLPDGRIKFIIERWQIFRDDADRPVRATGTCQDITERKLAEQRIADAQRFNQTLIETSPLAIIAYRASGEGVAANLASMRMLGAPSIEAVRSQNFRQIAAWQDSGLLEAADAALASGQPQEREIHVRNSFDKEIWLHCRVIPVTCEQEDYLLGFFDDIQERKRAEAERDRLFNLSLDLLCVAGFEGRLHQVNPAWTGCLGWTAEELTSRPMLDFVHPDDHEATLRARAEIHAGRSSRGFENRYRCKDGSYRVLSWNVHPLAESRQVFGVARDMTERRKITQALGRNEALLRMATQVSRLGAWQVEVPTMALTWSDEVRAIHETPPDFTPLVEEALNFYAPEFQERVRQVFGACVDRGDAFDEELQIITSRGRRVWARALGEAVRDEAGTIVRVQGAFQDITDRKNADLAQRQLALRLATTLESITEGFFTLDCQWRFSYVNSEAERMCQRQRSELLGMIFWDAFPGTMGSTFEREYRRAVAENVPVSFEDFYPPLDKWFEVRAYPSEVGLAVYYRDVTATRQAAQALRVSEERFRLLAKATNDAIWDWDLTTDALWWNEGFETLFGFSREEVETTIDSWLNRLHPDDQAAVVADVRRAIEGGAESWQGEYLFRRKDGHYASVLDRGHIIRGPAGQAVRMIGGMTDLTELKQTADKLREQAALLDNAHDAIMVRDVTHRITYWNKAAERLYGWTEAEALGRPIHELLHIDAVKFEEAGRALAATDAWDGEIEITAKSGAVLKVVGSWTLLRDGKRAPRSILTIDTDITERKKLEEQFLRAQRMESIGTLAGGIAHDLNNLLAPITMGVDLLKLYEPSPKSLPVIENIERSARRGADLVKQVLSFARGVEGARVALQVRHVMKEVDSIALNTFPKNIDFITSAPQGLWTVLADPTQLNQVVLNLCVNARDAMPNGGRLELTASNVDIDPQYAVMNRGMVAGRFVMIQVTDTGIGIPKEITDRIFEPFFTTKELGKGTGLGLSTALGIVRSHGGWVNVHSEVGRGSTFKVYLPALEAGESVPADQPVAEAVPRGNGELILVVDDETSILDITKQTLMTFGYRVVTAEDGAQAISVYAVQRDEIALVLTDMMMPLMDGATLILALQHIKPGVRVIAASGLKANHGVARATSAGVKHFLPKPYSADMLLRLVHQVINPGGTRPPV